MQIFLNFISKTIPNECSYNAFLIYPHGNAFEMLFSLLQLAQLQIELGCDLKL